jgi:hypothetical protein
MIEKKNPRRISSITTVVHTKVIPAILSMAVVVYFVLLLFSKYSAEKLLPLLLAMIMFSIIWFLKSRNLKVVYLKNDGLIVNGKKVLFNDMISIRNDLLHTYSIRYSDGVKDKSFRFIIDSIPFFTPAYMKQIKSVIDKNSNNLDEVSLF